jgi:PHD/YefM family antitoxin component YafN of YafNO toxin-antitoxin module
MIPIGNIRPLSDFLRNAKTYLARLKSRGEPEILTVNGKAQAVIMSAGTYERLVDDLETFKTMNVAHQSMLEMLRAGEVSPDALIRELRPQSSAASIPAQKAFADLERKLLGRPKKKAS